MKYLPDKPDENNVGKEFLFGVVNTLDTTFFERLNKAYIGAKID